MTLLMRRILQTKRQNSLTGWRSLSTLFGVYALTTNSASLFRHYSRLSNLAYERYASKLEDPQLGNS